MDDKSHEKTDRAERDEFVDQVLAGAKISVVRFSAKKGYVVQEVRVKLAEVFKIAAEAVAPVIANKAPEQHLSPVVTKQKTENVAPACPKYAAEMVKRQAKMDLVQGSGFGPVRRFQSVGRQWLLKVFRS